MRKHITILLTTILVAFAGSAYAGTDDIGHFEDDWLVEFVPDKSNIDNCRIFFHFLFHHGENDDGWRREELGAYLSIDGNDFGNLDGDGDWLKTINWDLKNTSLFTAWKFPQRADQIPITISEPKYSTNHSCKKSHYQYAHVEMTPPPTVFCLNKAKGAQRKFNIHGKYWRWGWAWTDDPVDKTREMWLIYDVDPGDFVIRDIDINADGLPQVTAYVHNGNSSKYSTFILKQEGSSNYLIYNNTIGSNQARNNDSIALYSAFGTAQSVIYQKKPVKLTAQATAFEKYQYLKSKSKESTLSYQGFPTPDNLQVQYNLENHDVTLKWTSSPIPDYAAKGEWWIRRTDETNNVSITYKVNDLNTKTFTDHIDADRKYSYFVYYHKNNWAEDRIVSALKTTEKTVSVSKEVNLKIAETKVGDSQIDFKLTFKASKKAGFYDLNVYRDGINVQSFKGIAAGQDHVDYSDIASDSNPLNTNTPHTYVFVISRNLPATYQTELQRVETTVAAKSATQVTNFEGTCGVTSNGVILTWKSVRAYTSTYVDKFRILRRAISDTGGSDAQASDTIFSTSINNTFTDQSCKAGVIYQYKLQIYNDQKWADRGTTHGYMMCTGSVSGRITYANYVGESSDIAAANTDVELTPFSTEDPDEEVTPLHSLLFQDDKDVMKLSLSDADIKLLNQAYTVSYWKMNDSNDNNEEWIHYAYTGGKDGKYRLTLSNEDHIIKADSVVDKIDFQTEYSLGGKDTYYDELQIWSRRLTADEILTYSTRHLSGEENGLLAYLPMDEDVNQGITFDMALEGSHTRGHHASLTSSIEPQIITAPVSFRTRTDANGNYSIKGLPLDEDGDDIIYRIQPINEAHVFSPASQSIRLSEKNKVFSERDFLDKTSITVSGTAYYKNGNFPVSGATIKVDGSPVTRTMVTASGRKSENITTDDEGQYCVTLSCGAHTISIELEGHQFTTASYSITGNANVKDLNFEDKTLMQLWGRVSGGSILCSRKLPSYLADGANIGQATLYLRPVSNMAYTLNTKGNDITMENGDKKLKDVTVIRHYDPLASEDSTIVIKTDANTGEFCALLPPIDYYITAGSTASVSNDELRAYDMPQIHPVLRTDGVFTDTCIVQYDPEPTFALVDAERVTTEGNLTSLALGMDSILVGQDKFRLYSVARVPDNPNLFTDTIKYDVKYPVFLANTTQCLYFYGREYFYNAARNEYTYQALPEGTKVSFAHANINADEGEDDNTIYLDDNGWGTYVFTVHEPDLGGNLTMTLQATCNLNGREYSYPKDPMNVYVIGENVSEGTGFITSGPSAIDFVLHRPPGSNSSATLHAGSTIISQTTDKATTTDSHGFGHSLSACAGIAWKAGPPILKKIFGEFKYYAKLTYDETVNDTKTRTATLSNGTYHATTLSSDISTGSGAAFCGKNGDVFVGHATQILMGTGHKFGFVNTVPASATTTPILLEQKGKKCYLVGYNDGELVKMFPDDENQFAYTRNYIESTLIPKIETLRNSLILPMGTTVVFDNIHPDSITNRFQFVSTVPADDSHFGQANYYKKVYNGGIHLEKADTLMDGVAIYNSFIESWKNTLRSDELERTSLVYDTTMTISSGAKYSNSISSATSRTSSIINMVKTSHTDTRGFEVGFEGHGWEKKPWKGKSDNEVVKDEINTEIKEVNGDINVEEIKNEPNNSINNSEKNDNKDKARRKIEAIGGVTASHNWIKSWLTNGQRTTSDGDADIIKVSYSIQDNDPYDYLTVSTSNSNNPSRLAFKTRGGATTNPWEGGEKTKYYNPGQVISEPTLMVQKPVIRLEQNVLTDIPNGHTTTLTLYVTNGSEINVPQYYNICLSAANNPDGLEILMDGRPLAQGAIPVWTEAGQTVTKTLTVRQSRQDILDYKGIRLFARGLNIQPFEYSNTKLSPYVDFDIHYKPSCSDITMRITDSSDRDINTVNQVTSDVARFTVTGYDLDYKGFQKIQLQRYDRSTQQWQTFKEWYVSTDEAKAYGADSITGRTTLTYDYSMHSLADDTYKFRAVTCGKYGAEDVAYEAPEMEIVKDITPPKVMEISPVSGTLTADGEVAITFNEDIYKERIVDANIHVTTEGTSQIASEPMGMGLQFNGGDPVVTSVPININSDNSSIEMWLQRDELGKEETIFTLGSNPNDFSFGYDSSDRLWVVADGTRLSSLYEKVSTHQPQFLHVGFADGKLYATCNYNDDNGEGHSVYLFWRYYKSEYADFTWNRIVYVNFSHNKSGICRFGENFRGKISNITIWNTPRTNSEEIEKSKDQIHTSAESGLQDYWPCDECHGTQAADRIQGRGLVLPSEGYWYVKNENHSASFDGKEALVLKSPNLNMVESPDYCVEMWAKASNQNASTSGEQELIATPYGGLTLNNGCPTLCGIQLSNDNLLDDKWHHLAVNVTGGLSVKFMLDGKIVNKVDADSVAAHLVKKGMPEEYVPEELTLGKNFKGSLDEVRIWSAALSTDVIVDNMYQQMDTTQLGLIWVQNMEDESIFKSNPNVMQSGLAPTLRTKRVMQNVYHTWTASDRKIVITPTEHDSIIDGRTLHFSVEKIADKHGNDILAPIEWTTVMNRSTLILSDNTFNFELEEGDADEKTLTLGSSGNLKDIITVSNIPSWLTLSENEFVLNPLKAKNITLSVSEDTPIGTYETVLRFTSNNTGITDIVTVYLTVKAVRPDWEVDSKLFGSSCSVIARGKKADNYTEDKSDMIVAFVNDDNGNPIYLGKAENTFLSNIYENRFMLNIYFDEETTDSKYTGALKNVKKDRNIHYLYWNNASGTVYTDVTLFNSNGDTLSLTLDNMVGFKVYGTPMAPCEFRGNNVILQELTYDKGWNWISINSRTANEMFEDYFPADGKLLDVKTQTNFAKFGNGKWASDVDLKTSKKFFRNMYLVNANEENSHIYVGTPVTPSETTFQINKGWNWLPYYPTMRMPLGNALKEIATEGDAIKSQEGFAYYTKSGWVGTLTNMEPGKGYMYNAVKSGYLSYPDSYVPSNKVRRLKSEDESSQDSETALNSQLSTLNYTHQYSMNMCAVIESMTDDQPMTDGTLRAYDPQGNLRGEATIGNVSSTELPVSFLTISGDESTSIILTLQTEDGTMYTSETTLPYVSNSMLGTPAEPLVVRFQVGNATGINLIPTLSQGEEDQIYDLSGRRAKENTHGVVIQGGEKRLNK